jgi:hypothetical protein
MDGVAVRPWWTVRTRLKTIYCDGPVSDGAYEGAEQLQRDCERIGIVLGSPLARLGLAGRGGQRMPDDAAMLNKLRALHRLRLIRDRPGVIYFDTVTAAMAYHVASLPGVLIAWTKRLS